MSALQAALGLAQLERIEELVARKREAFGWYRARLAGVDGLTLNAEPPQTKNSYWMTTLVLDPRFGLSKEGVLARLAGRRIDGRPFFYPLSSLPALCHSPEAQVARQRNQVSYRISPLGVNLPSALSLTEDQADFVCEEIKSILGLPRSSSARTTSASPGS